MQPLKYKHAVTYASRLTRNKQNAEDLVHDAWIAAKEKKREGDGNFITGCIRICYLLLLRGQHYQSTFNDSYINLHTDNVLMSSVALDAPKVFAKLSPLQQKIVLIKLDNPRAACPEIGKAIGHTARNTRYHLNRVQEAFKEAI